MRNDIDHTKAEIARVFQLQQANRGKVGQSGAGERIAKLKRIRDAINDRREELQQAVYADLRKPAAEAMISEVFPVTTEIKHLVRHLRGWMRPKPARTPIVFIGAKSEIRLEPKGVVLIISPWNFPFQLAVGPLISAIAAGNCVVLKPSEFSPNTARFLKSLLAGLFDEKEVAVFEGDHEVGKALLEQPFNHVFFTGSTRVGRSVMAAAAEHLSSVTLELGGKSPAIIDRSANVAEAAKKITWGKFINAGQTCIAPDYVLIPDDQLAEFVSAAKAQIQNFFGDAAKISQSPDYCRIINEKMFARLKNLVEEAVAQGAVIETGGEFAENDKYISPTLITGVPQNAAIMQEEIFGPVLPILTYKSLDDVFGVVNSMPNPLVLYIFARHRRVISKILANTSAGDTVINDVVVHFANPNLPFGGFNQSGIGKSHGYAGFKALSHERAVMRQPRHTMLQLLYPPYTKFTKKLIDLTVKYF